MRDVANAALAEAEAVLVPAGKDDFRRQLTAALALCAPSGMSEDDRNEWLRVAWATLRDVPADLLARGCDLARRYCDHPAKIVPTIMREIEAALARRRADAARVRELLNPPPPNPWERNAGRFDEAERCTPEAAAAIAAEFGIKAETIEKFVPRGPARLPTREDYLAMGVDPDAIVDGEAAAA